MIEDAQLGPAMLALNEKQRAFVTAAVEFPKRLGRWMYAVRKAGYGSSTSSNKSLSVTASRLAGDERIQAAIAEETAKRLRNLAPAAVCALERLVEDPSHRDHARAIGMILDRSDPIETRHKVAVEHEHRHSVKDVADVRARINELAMRAGLLPAPKPIDAEFTVVGEVH